MTVTVSYSPLTYNCNGSTTAFSVTWPFFLSSDLVVTHITSGGVETALVLNTDYTVSGGRDSTTGLPAVGTVTTLSTYASGVKIRISRSTPKTQSTSFTTAGAFPAKTVEAMIDRVHMIAEEGAGGSPAQDVDGASLRLETSGATDYWDGESYIARGFADPTGDTDLVTKSYADDNYGGAAAVAAAASASAAAASSSAAATSQTSAALSAASAAAASSAASAAAGFSFVYSTTTSMADPGTGTLRFNNATLASVTAIAIDDLANDTGNPDVSAWVLTFDDSTNTGSKGLLRLRKKSAPQNFVDFSITAVTDNSGWSQLTVSYLAGSGSFLNSDELLTAFYATGNKGADGGAGGVFTAASTSSVPVTINAATGQTANLFEIYTPGVVPGGPRTFFDNFGAFNTQAWMVISGLYRYDGSGNITSLIAPGATTGSANVAYNAINGYGGGMLGISNDVIGPNLLMQDNSLRSGYWRVTDAVPTGGAIGTGYAVGNVLTVSGGTLVGGASAATLTVSSVNATGQITGLTVTTTGRYTNAGPPITQNYAGDNSLADGTVTLTGGAGSGATAFITCRTLGETSSQVDLLDYTQALRFSQSGFGLQQFGSATLRENFHLAWTNWGVDPNDSGAMYSTGKIRANRGLYAVKDSVSIFGGKEFIEIERAIPTASGNTIEIGRIKLAGAATSGAAIGIVVSYSTGSTFREWSIPLVWQAGSAIDGGGTNLAGAWVTAIPREDVCQSGSVPFDLDLQQDNSTGDYVLRLRGTGTTSAGTGTVSIECRGRDLYSRFIPSTVTATGVSAPTRAFNEVPRSSTSRTKIFYYDTSGSNAPTNAATLAFPDGYDTYVLRPAGALTSLTCQIAAGSAQEGKTIDIILVGAAITTLTVSAPGYSTENATISSAAVGSRYRFTFTRGYLWTRTN